MRILSFVKQFPLTTALCLKEKKMLILFLLKLVFVSQLFMSTHSLSARAVLMPSIST